MEFSWAHGCLLVTFIFSFGAGLLPMTKPNGEPDLTSIVSHVTLMEWTISKLQKQVQTVTSELTAVNNKLQSTEVELISAKHEITSLNGELSFTKKDISSLKKELQDTTNSGEFANLKAEVEILKSSHKNLINVTVIDAISTDLKTNRRAIKYLKSEFTSSKEEINRTSHDLETVHMEVGNLFSQILTMKEKLQQTIRDVQSKQNMTELDLTATKTLVQLTSRDVKTVQTQVNNISGNVSSVRQNMLALANEVDVDVAFQVTLRHFPKSGWTTLIFDSAEYNIGGGYNQTTGMFTAPVPGSYIFWANVMFANPLGNHYVYINKGRVKMVTGFAIKEDAKDSGVASAMVVFHLDKGNQVYFTTDKTSNYIYGYGHSSYGGALLHAS